MRVQAERLDETIMELNAQLRKEADEAGKKSAVDFYKLIMNGCIG